MDVKVLQDASRSTLLLTFMCIGLVLFLVALSAWLVLRPDADGTPAMLLQIAMGLGVDIGVIGGGLAGIEHAVNTRREKEAQARRRDDEERAYDVRTVLLLDLLDAIGGLYTRDADRVLFNMLGSMERWARHDPGSPEYDRIQSASDRLKGLSENGLTPAFGDAFNIAVRRVREVRRDLPGEQQPSVGADVKRLSNSVRSAGQNALDTASNMTSAAAEHVTWVPRHRPEMVTSIKAAVSVAYTAQAEARSGLLSFEEATNLYDPGSRYADPSQPFAHRNLHLDKLHAMLKSVVSLSDAFGRLTAALLALRMQCGPLVDTADVAESLEKVKELLPVGPDPDRLSDPLPWRGSS